MKHFILISVLCISFLGCSVDTQARCPRQFEKMSEQELISISRNGLWEFVSRLKDGDLGGTIRTKDGAIDEGLIKSIEFEDLNYIGDFAGVVDDGRIHRFRINRISGLVFSVQIYTTCYTDVRWSDV
ncbi:MAG: hypothetical protein AAGK67_18380 [Pseudomonadota bacterium]